MRVLHRFEKPGARWAEIRERKVTQFRAIEFIVLLMAVCSRARCSTTAAKLNTLQRSKRGLSSSPMVGGSKSTFPETVTDVFASEYRRIDPGVEPVAS